MMSLNIKRLMLRAELKLHRTNPFLIVTVSIWLLAAIASLWLLPTRQSSLHSMKRDSSEAQARLYQQVQPVQSSQAPPDQQNLNAFMSNLGDARHAEQQLRILFTIAGDLELDLPQGQYKLACDEAGELCSYHIQLPVRGSYTRVRIFIEHVLRAIPFASIDELSFKRDSLSDGEIEARLGITLFTRSRVGMQLDRMRAD